MFNQEAQPVGSRSKVVSIMGKKKNTNRILITALVLVTITMTTLLAALAYQQLQGILAALPLTILALIIVAQLILYKCFYTQQSRATKYSLLSRKLVQVQAKQRRDERHALKILNHINAVSDQNPTHASIWQKPLLGFSGDLAIACESTCGKKYTLLADLTGHGIAAAMGAAPVASIFQATAKRGLPVIDIVIELNNRLEQLLPAGFFCSTAIIMSDQGSTTICNAGLPDILVCNENGDLVDTVKSEQLPFGIQTIEPTDVQLFTEKYHTPHQLYAVTDGLIETVGTNDEVFDMGTLVSLVATKSTGSSRIINIKEHFESLTKDSPQSDDISIVEVMIC